MRYALRCLVIASICAVVGMLTTASAHEHDKLPPGPIKDRHELMKSMGDEAKNINDAFNVGSEGFDASIIQRSANAIALKAHQIPSLFPPGSTNPNSRALPAIWQNGNWDKFTQIAKELETEASSLSASAGEDDENLPAKSKKMFGICKSCHDQFRAPEKKGKKGH